MQQEIIDNICKRLQCTVRASDLGKLAQARELLVKMQYRQMIDILHASFMSADINQFDTLSIVSYTDFEMFRQTTMDSDDTEGTKSEQPQQDKMELGEEEECLKTTHQSDVFHDLPEDAWHGYFHGYQILNETNEFTMNELKKCIELKSNVSDEDLDSYLRAGICCFMLDLFIGTPQENQAIIVRLRESELKIARELRFPISLTLCVKLSPRLQYTGLIGTPTGQVELAKGAHITLSTDRYWSTRGTAKNVYVNGRFLLMDVNSCDFILIGTQIQLRVRVVKGDRLHCKVIIGGTLKSRMPVLFPSRCAKFLISVEELEDITFAQEVGVNIIISYIAGTREYFKNLQDCLKLLKCDRMRVFARIVLNEIKGCDHDEIKWMIDSYDGFIVEIHTGADKECSVDDDASAAVELMHLCPAGEQLLCNAYEKQKPIMLDAIHIAEQRILITPEHYMHIFFYPDKYIFRNDDSRNSLFYFDYLQNARFAPLPEMQLSKLIYCDASHTGSDSLARATVVASYEMNAAAIFVCSTTGRMALKIAHFRPNVPIILLTHMRSAEHFFGVYHNVLMLYFGGTETESHYKTIYKHLLFALAYAMSQKLLKHNDNVIFVYGKEPGTKFPDKYLAYKFDEKYFSQHLQKILFK